ncbi:WbqC family protein [candidate division TA06 bacterium]|uniref:WbqC family protein n=1 Tax=candidate division TA06 bacterium TaxID=2250710 RepID=A0A933MHM1_UNCT6|nr:WbqC family protein [candidate division TA06 bacterium]
MIIAAHQPNYLPWAGYFYKMVRCDVFVFMDSVQYSRTSYTARCSIKQNDGNASWLSVPVLKKGRYFQNVSEVIIDNQRPWQAEHLKTLESCYSRTPHFKEYSWLLDLAYGQKWENLSQLNRTVIMRLAEHLGIKTKFVDLSTLDVKGSSTEMLVSLCRSLNADEYLSGTGGQKYLDQEQFRQAGISLKYTKYQPQPYPQPWGEFAPGLSMIDMLFNCGPEETQKIIIH